MLDISPTLKAYTNDSNKKLEAVSYAREIMSGQLTKVQYSELIDKNYAIYTVIEPIINQLIQESSVIELEQFYSDRLNDLKKDSNYLPSQKQDLSSLKPFHLLSKDIFTILGVLYVLEGSRLGGKVITKALSRNIHLKSIPAFHFYVQENISIGSRWRTLQSLLGKYIKCSEDLKTASVAADYTFDYFYKIHSSIIYS